VGGEKAESALATNAWYKTSHLVNALKIRMKGEKRRKRKPTMEVRL
jgi:hypothetical protein